MWCFTSPWCFMVKQIGKKSVSIWCAHGECVCGGCQVFHWVQRGFWTCDLSICSLALYHKCCSCSLHPGHRILNTVDCTNPNGGRLPRNVDLMMSDFAGGASGFPMTFEGGKYTGEVGAMQSIYEPNQWKWVDVWIQFEHTWQIHLTVNWAVREVHLNQLKPVILVLPFRRVEGRLYQDRKKETSELQGPVDKNSATQNLLSICRLLCRSPSLRQVMIIIMPCNDNQ